LRHYREKHKPGFECSHLDCNYEWSRSRRYEYRKHLKKKHGLEGDKIDEILAMVPRPSHRRGGVIKSDIRPHSTTLPIERYRQSLTEPQQRPLILPLLAVKTDANHTSPTLVPVVPSPRFLHAESDNTTAGHTDTSGLEHLAATHGPSRTLSEEELALLSEIFQSISPDLVRTCFFIRDIYDRLCSQIYIDPLLPASHPT
jgi:hypothetical protein